MSDDEQSEDLTQEFVQKRVGKAILEVGQDSDRYLDLFLSEGAESKSLAEVAIGAISKLKTVEVLLLTTIREVMKEQGVPDGGVKFLNFVCKESTLVLMLLNELVKEEELLDMYEEEEVSHAIHAFKSQGPEAKTSPADIHQLTKDLREFLDKARQG